MGLWAQTLQSCMIPMRRGSQSMMPAFPAVERILTDAEAIRAGRATGGGDCAIGSTGSSVPAMREGDG